MQYLQDLHKYSIFGGLLNDQLEKILPMIETEDYAAGTNIIIEETTNDKIFLILEGRVLVSRKGLNLYEFSAGEAFGEMEVLEIMPSAATIRTMCQTKLLTLSYKALRDIYKLDIKIFSMIIMNLARDLSRRLRVMNDIVARQKRPEAEPQAFDFQNSPENFIP